MIVGVLTYIMTRGTPGLHPTDLSDRKYERLRWKPWVAQVVAILESGDPLPFTIQAASLDLPELQGEPEDIAREKCRLAHHQ